MPAPKSPSVEHLNQRRVQRQELRVGRRVLGVVGDIGRGAEGHVEPVPELREALFERLGVADALENDLVEARPVLFRDENGSASSARSASASCE